MDLISYRFRISIQAFLARVQNPFVSNLMQPSKHLSCAYRRCSTKSWFRGPSAGGRRQLDVNNFGVTYLQKINDAVTINPLHIETGMWLLLPPSTIPAQPDQMLARLSAIPHGDSLMAQGKVIAPVPAPIINPASSTPTLNPAGPALTRPYLDPFFTTPLPPGLPPEWIQGKAAQDIIANPNLLLQGAIADEVKNGQRIIQTEVLQVSTTIAGNPTTAGIFNVPFVQKNANAASLTAIFWIETVLQDDGSTFLQLQYTQTVILNFLGSIGRIFQLRRLLSSELVCFVRSIYLL